jgi:hypothetical protein
MTVYCVTGTDTEVGKTVVTAALAAVFRGRGQSVAVIKPAQTGVAADEPGDGHEVLRLAGPVTVHEGIRLPDPSPPTGRPCFEGTGVVIGAWPAEPGLAERHNREDLPRYTGVPVLGAVPDGAGRWDSAAFRAAAPSWLPGL